MAVFSQPLFFLLVATMFVAMQLQLGRMPRTTWFGLLNLIAVWLLFGLVAALALAFAALGFYTAMLLYQKFLEDSADHIKRTARFSLYAAVGAAFVTYKIWQDPAADLVQQVGLGFALQGLAGPVDRVTPVLETLAFSYVALRLVDFLRAGFAGERLANPLALSGFLVPFFMSPSGPVNEYETHLEMDEEEPPAPTIAYFVDAVYIIVLGYFFKFFVAASFSLFFVGISDPWPMTGLADTAVFLTFVFFEFSGYSLIALGVGMLLGVPTPKNFNHPYFSTTFTEFWGRWHVSLGAFVRRTFYFPIRLSLTRWFRPASDNRAAIHAINAVALLVPFAFVGLWHRFTWAFLLWGISLALVVAIETVVREEVLPKTELKLPRWLSRPLGVAYTLIMVVITLQIAALDFAS